MRCFHPGVAESLPSLSSLSPCWRLVCMHSIFYGTQVNPLRLPQLLRRNLLLSITPTNALAFCGLLCAAGGQIPNADKTAEYLVTNAVSSGCDVSKLSTDRFSSCKSLLVCSGFFSARIVSWAEASTRRAMLRASS